MESADGQRGRDSGGQKRTPLDIIMSQLRRKRSATDRKPLGSFLSRTLERTGIPEDREADGREEKAQSSCVAEAAETKPDVGWGRVRVFLQRLGKRADSRSLGLAHCDLTATDLLELGLSIAIGFLLCIHNSCRKREGATQRRVGTKKRETEEKGGGRGSCISEFLAEEENRQEDKY